jgi:ubiquinone/menaquinone biosynthesis C-methylase UbiE
MVSAGLREAIVLKYQSKRLLNPFLLAKTFGIKFSLFLPLVYWRYYSRFKTAQFFLKSIIADYETAMFRTLGEKILSTMEINDIQKFLNPQSFDLILDVGIGSGRVTREILKKSNANVIGLDVSKTNIESAKTHLSIQNLGGYELVVADGQYLPFKEDVFDGIVCVRTLKYLKNYEQAISEASRVLKSGKVFVLDLSSPLGYELILRHITPSLSSRGSHVFNFFKMKRMLKLYGFRLVDFVPLQKIPYKVWTLSKDHSFLKLLIVLEGILRRITPLLFSISILVKCVKEDKNAISIK